MRLPRRRAAVVKSPDSGAVPTPTGGRPLVARLRGILVALRLRRLLSAPGATAAGAATGVAAGIVLGVVLAALVLPIIVKATERPE